MKSPAHVLIKIGEGNGHADFREIEDGIRTGEGFPTEARAFLWVERVAWNRNANDHAVGVIECFLALAEWDAKLEIAARWKSALACELSLGQVDKIPGDPLMIESPAGHGVNISGDVFVTDFGAKLSLEVIVSGDGSMCHFQRHG